MRQLPHRELRVRCAHDVRTELERAPLAPPQQPELTLDLGQRVLPVMLHLALSAPRLHAGVADDDDLRPTHGFDSDVYRPPRR
jgi:hypothetical protein